MHPSVLMDVWTFINLLGTFMFESGRFHSGVLSGKTTCKWLAGSLEGGGELAVTLSVPSLCAALELPCHGDHGQRRFYTDRSFKT